MDSTCFAAYAQIVQRAFGIQLPPEKKALLESRLFKLFQRGEDLPVHDAEGFLRWLRQDKTGRARKLLSEAITTHHTYFLREADHFRCFRDTVLPWIEQEARRTKDVRTWCAACSTGEEAYTLEMLLTDYFSLRGTGWETSLLATDLSEEVIAKAARGVYEAEAVGTLPESWQRVYFHPTREGRRQAADSLRQSIVFRPFNLLTPAFPFRRPFHAIFCRNVMIYFDRETRMQLVRKFYDWLVPGGYLFVGHAETVDREMAPFLYVQPSVYRKSPDAASAAAPAGDEVRDLAASGKARVPAGASVLLPSLAERGAARLRKGKKKPVRLIVMGASTGGTEALAAVLTRLAPPLPPIVVVQHIPPGFSELFAGRLERDCRLTAGTARDGEYLEPDHIYIAPGDQHIRVRRMGERLCLATQKGPLVNGHCPSVDVLFQSVEDARLAPYSLGILLTGMGDDGAKGLLAMRQGGAHTIGQDEATSVVYGMPRAAWQNGAVERQLPLPAIAPAVMAICR